MKKFISLLIASAMVVSLVPATAFAADVTATAKVVGAQTVVEDAGITLGAKTPELQIKIADAAYTTSESGEFEIAIELDNAVFSDLFKGDVDKSIGGKQPTTRKEATDASYVRIAKFKDSTPNIVSGDLNDDKDELVLTFDGRFEADDVIIIQLATEMIDTDAGEECTVSIDSDLVDADDLVFATVADRAIEASIKKLTTVAIDEAATLTKTLKIEETVGDTLKNAQILVLELSKGFEFDKNSVVSGSGFFNDTAATDAAYALPIIDDEYAYFHVSTPGDTAGEVQIDGLKIVADEDVNAGDIATIEVTLYDSFTGTDITDVSSKISQCEVEVAEVVDYKVVMSVDEDKDVPVYYAGVDADNSGISADDDHISLEVTIEETFPGAWENGEFELTLPEGVYVTNIDVNKDTIEDADRWNAASYYNVGTNYAAGSTEAAFAAAYKEGGFQSFVFEKRAFDENPVTDPDCYVLKFELELVANADFEGEVVLGLVGDDVEESEVVIAEFVPAYTIEASQNDVIIDYRNTPIDTPIVITEAEADLWTKDMVFFLDMEGQYIDFDDEGDATLTAGDDMEFKYSVTDTNDTSKLTVNINKASDDEAAEITIEGVELYMSRSLAAGPYALKVTTTAGSDFMDQVIFAREGVDALDEDKFVEFVKEVDDSANGYTVNEKFVNIVTAGSDQADTFTTNVIVPIGESYIYAGGKQIELDVPAYVSADGYTMLPVRAVATAIGVSTSNVLWDGATQQVTIIYGTKTIAMVVGQSYMTVNGTAIPTSAAPEIVDGRTFLPLRDLATALSVTTIDWDADTRTASLN